MDNNPVPPAPTAPSTPEPTPAPVQPEPAEAAPKTGEPVQSTSTANPSRKRLTLLIIVLVVLVLLAVVEFLYLNNILSKPTTSQTSQAPTKTTAPATKESVDSLGRDLQSVDANQPDDLSSVDKDLQSL